MHFNQKVLGVDQRPTRTAASDFYPKVTSADINPEFSKEGDRTLLGLSSDRLGRVSLDVSPTGFTCMLQSKYAGAFFYMIHHNTLVRFSSNEPQKLNFFQNELPIHQILFGISLGTNPSPFLGTDANIIKDGLREVVSSNWKSFGILESVVVPEIFEKSGYGKLLLAHFPLTEAE